MRRHPQVPSLPALTTLRFFAAAWVVAYHLARAALANVGAPRGVQAFVGRGWLGVPFFFILSGFILVHVYGRHLRHATLDRRTFWWARVARVYPMYLVSLLVALPLLILDHPRLGPEGTVPAVASLVSTPLLLQSWLPWLSYSWNYPGWSLSVEAFFYAVFPVVGLLAVRLRRPSLAAGLTLAATFLVQGLVGRIPVDPWLNFAAAFPPWWLGFFAFGCILGEIRHRAGDAPPRLHGALALAATTLVVAVLALDPTPVDRPSIAVLVAEGLFGLLILGFSWPVAGAGWMASRIATELGEASYALYLLHVPADAWAARLLGRPVGPPVAHDVPQFAVVFAALVALSILAHRAIERPARRAIRARTQRGVARLSE